MPKEGRDRCGEGWEEGGEAEWRSEGVRAVGHLSKTRNTYARKIDDVLVGVLMTREMDVRTETLYILRGGKNIMYYTLPRRVPLMARPRTLARPNLPSVVTAERRAPVDRRFFGTNSSEKNA